MIAFRFFSLDFCRSDLISSEGRAEGGTTKERKQMIKSIEMRSHTRVVVLLGCRPIQGGKRFHHGLVKVHLRQDGESRGRLGVADSE